MRCKAKVALPRMTINGNMFKEGDEFGVVNISETEFKFLNEHPQITGLKYEEIKETNPIKDEADSLGIKYHKNISDEKLQDKINEFKTNE